MSTMITARESAATSQFVRLTSGRLGRRDDLPEWFVVDPATWQDYLLLSDGDEQTPGLDRVTYDGRRIEVMPVGDSHEMWKGFLAMLVEKLFIESKTNFRNYGNMTIRDEDLEQGFEPDECYYVRRYDRIRGKAKLDLSIDPAPDFAIEVEVTRRVVDRLPIYAAMGIEEIWRYVGKRLRVLRLNDRSAYDESSTSGVAPKLPVAEFAEFVTRMILEDPITVDDEFRRWLREKAVVAGNG